MKGLLALRDHTRRHFFEHCGIGLGSIALGEMLAREGRAALPSGEETCCT